MMHPYKDKEYQKLGKKIIDLAFSQLGISNDRSRILAFDFDNTLNDSSNVYPACGEPIWAGVYALQEAKKMGHKIIIWTVRSDVHLDIALNWLRKNDIPFDKVNENIRKFSNSPKVYADAYFDDRGFNFLILE